MVPGDQVEAPAEEEIVGCSPLLQSPMEQSGPEEPFAAEASTAPIQSQSQPRSNRRSQTNRRAPLQEEDDGTGQLISIVSGISQQIEAQRCPHTLFIMSLLPLVQQVPEDRYFAMRMAVQQCIYSFTVPRHPSSLSNHPPPPQNVPNPYPSSFENVRSIYDINTSDIPHPIPSPIPTVISPPVRPLNLTPPMPPTNSEISRNIRPQNLHIVPPSRSRAAKSGNYYTTLPPVSSNNPPAASTIPQMASGEPHIDSQYGTQSRQLTYSNYLSAPLPKYSEVPGPSSNIFKKGAETYYNL